MSVPPFLSSNSPMLTWCGFWLSPLALPCGMSMSITDHILKYPKCKNAAQSNNLTDRGRQWICHAPPPPVKLILSEWGCTPVFIMSTMEKQNKQKSVLMIMIMKQTQVLNSNVKLSTASFTSCLFRF